MHLPPAVDSHLKHLERLYLLRIAVFGAQGC